MDQTDDRVAINHGKHFIKWLVIALAGAVVGLFVGAIFEEPVNNFIKTIVGKEPYPSITITKIYRIENPTFVNLSQQYNQEEGSIEFTAHMLEEGILGQDKSINIREDTKEVYFVENGIWTKGLTYPNSYIDNTSKIYQKNCVMHFFSHLSKDSKPKASDIEYTLRYPVKRKDGTDNLTEFSVLVKNNGNEVMKDLYFKFCSKGIIISSTGGEIDENCLKAEIPFLYNAQEKYYQIYTAGNSIDKISLNSNMDNREIPQYVINIIAVIYTNATCNDQRQITMHNDEFAKLLKDLRPEDIK